MAHINEQLKAEQEQKIAANKAYQRDQEMARIGASFDECAGKQAQVYSPRLGVMAKIDRATDELLSQVNRLREFRKMIERGNDRDANLVEEAIKILAPK